jgi:hypothetical protein
VAGTYVCDDSSTVSSLGLSVDFEDSNIMTTSANRHNGDIAHIAAADDDGGDDDDSAVRIVSQIKQLRRNSMARFEATVGNSPTSLSSPSQPRRTTQDCIPARPFSSERSPTQPQRTFQDGIHDRPFCSERNLRGMDREFYWGESHDVITALDDDSHADLTVEQDRQQEFPRLGPRRSSMPARLMCLNSSPCMDEPSMTKLTLRADRWSVESSESLQRDCEIVKSALERASSHRMGSKTKTLCNDHGDGSDDGRTVTAGGSPGTAVVSAATVVAVAMDTMLVPPRRCY